MAKSKLIFQAKQEVYGKHLKSNEWIMYSGKLSIYDRKTTPVILKLKCEQEVDFVSNLMDDTKEFKGNSVSDVFGKLAKWYYKYGIIFQN
ncbi:MAG: hypothetical protein GXO47_05530 [Chlorobi bacterium]|nr:hypothetical protein [Chlorobiota bacterium]